MSSNEIKEDLVDWYGGNERDWKRISKKKKGPYEIRTFENKKINLIKTIVTIDEDYHLRPEYFPKDGEFWIYVCDKGFDPNKVDETKSYFDPNFDCNFGDIFDEKSVLTMVILKSIHTHDAWYDQHSSHLIEHYFGVKDFSKMFEEPCENRNILTKDIPLGDIRKMCEDAGMKFVGYRNIADD